MESSLRSMNNLLERLHASFFFYLLPHPGWFHKIGAYLPAAILLGAGMTFRGLGLWVDAGWRAVNVGSAKEIRWGRRDRQVHIASFIIVFCLATSWSVYRLRRYIAIVSEEPRWKPCIMYSPLMPIPLIQADISTGRISYSCAAISVLAPLVLSRLVTAFAKTRDTSVESVCQTLRSTVLTTGAITRIISGALITALAMINFTQAVFFGLMLFFAIEFGTWWAITCAQASSNSGQSRRSSTSKLFAITVVVAAGYWRPRALIPAIVALLLTTTAKLGSTGSSTLTSRSSFEIYASVTLIQLIREYGFDFFSHLVAFVLDTTPESRWDLQRLLFQESALFGNRFMAEWLCVVQGLQLVGIVILYI